MFLRAVQVAIPTRCVPCAAAFGAPPAHSSAEAHSSAKAVPSRERQTARKTAAICSGHLQANANPQRHLCCPALQANLRGHNLHQALASITCSGHNSCSKTGCWATFAREQRICRICDSLSAMEHEEICCGAQHWPASAPAIPLHRATAGSRWILQAHTISICIICGDSTAHDQTKQYLNAPAAWM